MTIEFKLPDLGENIEDGDVTRVLVAVGDTIEKDQSVLEMETGKATLEIPSGVAGQIVTIAVKEGDKARVGQLILTVKGNGAGPAAEKATPEPVAETKASAAPPAEPQAKEVPPPPPAPAAAPASATAASGVPVAAAPSVRKFAREIGIEVGQVPGSGTHGRVSIDDVKAHAKRLNEGRAAMPAGGVAALPLPDFSAWGDIERTPMNNVRKITVQHMSFAWSTIPHVTQHDKADITDLEVARKRFSKKVEKAGGKLTPTAILLKVVASAIKAFPTFGASIDTTTQEIILKKYIHIGVAVATPKGLVVPVIRNVDEKNITELSIELSETAERVRDGKITPNDMQGGTFTISNLGGIGGGHFTPIVNYPEVAILGVGRAAIEAVHVNGKFEPRLMMPLSLSYDHRLIDGADGARFLRWIVEAIDDPLLIAMEG